MVSIIEKRGRQAPRWYCYLFGPYLLGQLPTEVTPTAGIGAVPHVADLDPLGVPWV